MATKKAGQIGLLTEADFSRGVLTDLPRTAMPQGTCAASVDFLLHRQGEAEKRGGTSYYGNPVVASVPAIVDSSTSDHELITHGSAHIDTTTKKFGDGSVGFSGANDFLSLDASSDFIFGTGNFTIDFQLYITSLPAARATLVDFRPVGAAITATNILHTDSGSPGTSLVTDTVTPEANRLYLLTVSCPGATATTVTGAGLTWVKVAEKTQAGIYVAVFRAMKSSGITPGPVTINFSTAPTSRTFVNIDEFIGVTTSGTDGSGAIVASATNGVSSAKTLTVTMATFANSANTAFGAFGSTLGGGSQTAGSGFTLLWARSSTNGILTEYKTAQANPSESFTANRAIAGIAIELATATYPVVSLGSDAKITFTGGFGTILSSALSTAAFHHVAVARSSGTTKLFIDGVQVGSGSADTSSYSVGGDRPAIGGSGVTEGSEILSGFIDELRVSNIARWTTGFTAPVAAHTNDANTMLLMHGDVVIESASGMRAVVFADFPTGGQLLGSADDNHLYRITEAANTDLGSLGATRVSPMCKPVLHVSGTSRVIFPATDGTSGPFAYNGTTLAALGGSPPAGRIAGIFKARLLLANSSANPNRLWFSPLDLSTAWDTTEAWVDFDHAITGLATVRNTLLVFSSGHSDYVTGAVPPGTQGFDMAQGPLGDIGCTDARSIDTWQDNVIFANQQGVYMTNGAGFRCLTEPQEFANSGIGNHWRSLFAGSGLSIHGGVLGDFYVVTVRDSSDTLVETWMCYLPRRAWWQLGNFDAGMYASNNVPELYYAARDAAQIVALTGIFTPSAANKNDANGNPVEPILDTRFMGSGPVLKSYEFARLTYELIDAGADAPTMAVSVAPGTQAVSFTDLPESPLAATTDDDSTRKRVTVNRDSQGVTFRFAQTGASESTKLLALELEERLYESVVDGSE